MKPPSDQEMAAVLKLDGPIRFSHFVKRVVDTEQAWGLWQDGWALFADNDANQVFPLWPARAYAELCREGQWANYQAREIPLDDLLRDLIPRLTKQGVRLGVFPTPTGKGVLPSAEELALALREELEKY